MVASSSKHDAPFLTYLTVFKSRLAVGNLLLPITGYNFTPDPALDRALTRLLSERVDVRVDSAEAAPLLEHLLQKKVIGATIHKRGRYGDWTLRRLEDGRYDIRYRGEARDVLSVFRTDMWMSDPRLRSTIGVPTPDNAGEVIELCHQLRLLTRTKNSWTSAGHTAAQLRLHGSSSGTSESNPFVLGLEAAVLLRQIIAHDLLLFREVVREVCARPGLFSRDEIAGCLPEIAERAYRAAKSTKVSPEALKSSRNFVQQLRQTAARAKQAPRGPGVLEHRTSPRLEWLTDLGALHKDGLAKNGFDYHRTADCEMLLRLLDAIDDQLFAVEDAACAFWSSSACWKSYRATLPVHGELSVALRKSYSLLKRSVGPSPIRDVCFAALLIHGNSEIGMRQGVEQLVGMAAGTAGITLSGGRYSGAPEFVHFSTAALGD
jgi:hypothetical protein